MQDLIWLVALGALYLAVHSLIAVYDALSCRGHQ